jgi:hypothetical protein
LDLIASPGWRSAGNVDLFATGAEPQREAGVNPLGTALANLDLAFVGQTLDSDPGGCERCFTAEELGALRGGQVPDETVLSIFGGWVHRFGRSPAALPELIDRWFYVLASGELEFEGAEATGWLLTHGVGLLARVPGAAADNAAARLADLELIVQSREEGSK